MGLRVQARPPSLSGRTNLELAIATADYIAHCYTLRQHSALGYLTPYEYEHLHSARPQATQS